MAQINQASIELRHLDGFSAPLDDQFPPETESEILRLARNVTKISEIESSKTQLPGETRGLFFTSSDPTLDPRSGKFDFRHWTSSLLDLRARQHTQNPTCTAGVSFLNLNVYGYGHSTDYQKTVGNVLFEIPRMLKTLMGSRGKRIDILRDFEGVVEPGELLLVLGPPGSGCSTFLKTISGETHGLYVDSRAEINYQGIPREIMHSDFRGEVVYNAESDVHFASLTVGQTLEFAAKARTPRSRLPGVTREQWATHMKDVMMAIFGLTHVEHTKIGNEFVRGVSGGERKRVSIAEIALSGSALQCWDNSTRGLDSASALEFVKNVRISTKYSGATAIVAVYQASQDIYDTFDKVTVIYEGRQIYFGPAATAKRFFVDMGFQCPERQTTADFLTSLTNPAERRVRPGFEFKVPRTPDEFARRWKSSQERRDLLTEIDVFNRRFPIGGTQLDLFRATRKHAQAKHMRSKSPFTISTPMQVRLCLTRGLQRLKGDMDIFIGGAIGQFVTAIIMSSLFFNLPADTSSFYTKSALLFWAVLMNAVGGQLEILTLYEQRPIVEKHARMALYHPASEAVSSMICDLPSKFVNTLCFNLPLYFMTNLRREPGAFFTYLLFALTSTFAMSMIFRTIGASSRTIYQALVPSGLLVLALLSHTGFVIPVQRMRPWFRWINYLDPIAYVFEALMINEFDGREFPCRSFIPAGPSYQNITNFERVCNTRGANAGSTFVLGSDFIAVSFNYYRADLWRNFGILLAFILFFLATYLTATEFIKSAKSKGEVLVFLQDRIPVGNKARGDEEHVGAMTADAKMGTHNQERILNMIQRQTANFQWEDVCYDIRIKGEVRRLLDNVDGWVEPGKLTALMGASGAGKTTLLDVLASRVTTGVISGHMLVHGQHRDESFQRKTGYAQQNDLHLGTSTVREALIFSARLRQPYHVPDKEKLEYVEEIIRLLGMVTYADAVVGVPGEGLNIEQRKRLTIGVELVAKPELLLFLDEPTSGLDSQTAWSIVTLLRRLAENGQAILCTIHQPSALLFQEFDRLLVLAHGGKTVYFGDIGKDAGAVIDYFSRQSGEPCPPKANPAEWMLQVIGAAPGSVAKHDFAAVWRQSAEYMEMKRELAKRRDLTRDGGDQKLHSARQYAEFAVPLSIQFLVCWKRVLVQYWRTPSYIYSKLTLSVFTALFIGFTFWRERNDLQGLQDQIFSIFLLMTIFSSYTNQIMPHFVTQRALYEARERPSKTYSWISFISANICAELPWNALMGVVMFFCWYFPIGFYRSAAETGTVTEREALMFLLILVFMLFTSLFSQMMIAGIEATELAGNLANLLFCLCLLFCGVLITPDQLSKFWKGLYRISPFSYLVDGMLSAGSANANAFCSDVELLKFNPPNGLTCGDYLSDFMSSAGGRLLDPNSMTQCTFCPVTSTNAILAAFGSSYANRWRNFGLMWVYVVFNFCAVFFLYWLARVPKKSKAINIQH
uniref:ABC transporter domain-containing protein n=1 Tax=Moniliophthora roreri TaxID=221103 RepID=A0A0W0GAH4_MONRR